MTNYVFDLCAMFLRWLAGLLGTTYEAVNVWIFCVIWPIFTIVLIWMVLRQRRQIKELRAYGQAGE